MFVQQHFLYSRRLFIVIVMQFCGCGSGKDNLRGKNAVEVFRRIQKQDRNQFALNAEKGIKHSNTLIERLANNKPLASSPCPSHKNDFTKLVSGSLSQYIKRQVLKSEYDELIEKYSSSSEKWSDPNFPPNDKSWGDPRQPVQWRRISQILPNAKFVEENFAPADILQGKLGNCYFLSAIAGLAQKPYRIKKIFPSYDMNNNGIYMARLLHRGVYQEVVVDDFVPCTPKGELYGAQPAGGNQIWVMILEKCWAKLFGSYEAIDGGLPHEVLRAFSSAPTFNYRVTRDSEELELLWNKIYEADQNQYIICCGTAADSRGSHLQQLGLVGGHAYTVLGVYERPYRLLKIRNPWGNMEWKGVANDNDKAFWSKISPQQQLQMGHNFKDDGVFFMLWEDFEKYFIVLDICRVDDNAHYFYLSNSFQRGKPKMFQISTQSGDLTLIASQKSKRQLKKTYKNKDIKLANSTFILASADDSTSNFSYLASKSDESYSELYLTYRNIPKGKYQLCSFVEGQDSSIDSTISVYTNSNFSIVQSSISDQEFLHRVFLDHARNNENNKQILCQNPLEWVVFDIITDGCGFGYTAFHLDGASTKKLGLEFDQRQYEQNGMDVLPPFKGAGKFKLICQKGQQLIVLCRLKVGVFMQEFAMPTPKMYRLK